MNGKFTSEQTQSSLAYSCLIGTACILQRCDPGIPYTGNAEGQVDLVEIAGLRQKRQRQGTDGGASGLVQVDGSDTY